MKHVSILIPRGRISVVNIEGAHQILSEVNALMAGMGKAPLFKVQLIGLSDTDQARSLFTVHPDLLIQDVPQTDLIIIPAVHENQKKVLADNKAFIPWITRQYQGGAEVASFCIGSFLLAATGLLNGKTCTTHWKFFHEFRLMFPEAHLVDDKIMTEQEGIYTSGGAYAYLNLLLYLIEKHAGRDVAIFIAKAFMIDIDRTTQSPFIIFQGQKTHEDEEIKQAQEFIEQNFKDKITIDFLASEFAMGRRNLERRFKKATSNTVTEYIQRVKVEAAKMSLESSREHVNEVMYKVGYTDQKAFRTVFRRITGLSPMQYRNKYNREAAVSLS